MNRMSKLELQESLSHKTEAELIESITKLTETYSENLATLTSELLTRQMQNAGCGRCLGAAFGDCDSCPRR